ncbi:MAG: histidine ammonia-lyase, partial [Gammaproteobacteria bacterium]|nr:histidine ammonia-lyase [Gammaproteobacteria bacterium]
MMEFLLKPGQLTYSEIKLLLDESVTLFIDSAAHGNILRAEEAVANVLLQNKTVYGINTGFGSLANKKIDYDNLEKLQHSLVLSHAAGVGEFFSDKIVRLILALKINSLARGFSGVRLKIIDALVRLFNCRIYPCIPCKGSVGASGDLAPLAHLSTILLGIGEVRYEGKILPAREGLRLANLEPFSLAPKEGLALLNGTQVSTSLALVGLIEAENIFIHGLIAGALSVEAVLGSRKPFDERIQSVRGHKTQQTVASILRELLMDSAIGDSHISCEKVQDPYSLRCQPQVMGACLAHILFAKDTLVTEANAISDNPIIFSEDNEIISGGNFHAEPVAMAADTLALSIAEIGSLSERRIALLIDQHFSGLPSYLVKNPGINSGFMGAQITAAALASENKCLAHPTSVDSIPTAANQEDHVSMATHGARRLLTMTDNIASIVAIELLAACQGIDLRRPLKTSQILEKIHKKLRDHVPFYSEDHYFAPDIATAKQLILSEQLQHLT